MPPWIDLVSETSEPRSEWAQGEAGKSLPTGWFQDTCCSPRETSKWKGGKKIAVSSNCLEMMLRRRNAGWVLVGERKGKHQDEGS